MNYKHFSIEEREIIQTGMWEKQSIRTIAKSLGRSPARILLTRENGEYNEESERGGR
jgi:IS30 family transposase